MKNMLGVYIGTEEFLILAPRVQLELLEVSFVEDIFRQIYGKCELGSHF